MRAWLERVWFDHAPGGVWLLPLSALFGCMVGLRRLGYRLGLFYSAHPGKPVVVIGNITVGGVGKTPLTVWLAEELQARGWRVGIVTRGYGGTLTGPVSVTSQSDPRAVGDEPVLLATRTSAQVVVARDRLAGARVLAAHVDVILADDGLQHYRLRRDVEIAVVDGSRRLGNGRLLPAGPLREPESRLREVDLVVVQGVVAGVDSLSMTLLPVAFVDIATKMRSALGEWRGRTVHAVAGIGHPARFFCALKDLGLVVIEHPLADHARIGLEQVTFADRVPVVMTEKDAVKCRDLPPAARFYLEVKAMLPMADAERLMARVISCVSRS